MISAAVRPLASSPAPEPVAESAAMREVLDAALDVAPTPTTVLLLGESGTGKELVARFVHARSGRAGPWVAVNCAALPSELLESELFGHERGAFTGAGERREGKFELAHGGTLLLDEVSELPLALQAKLLRVLQEREVDRVGGRAPVRVDVRVIATSNRDLADMVRRGEFRSDLYYRLHVFPIALPPLRDRRDDLAPLAERVLADAAAALGRPAPALAPASVDALRRHAFPGNVRELRNVLERALVRCRGAVLEPAHLRLDAPSLHVAPSPHVAPAPLALAAAGPAAATGEPQAFAGPARGAFLDDALPLDLGALERLAIAEALRRVHGNRTHAARLLGIGLRTLRNKLRAYRIAGVEVEPPAAPAARPELPCTPRAHAPDSAGFGAPPRARRSHEEAA